MDGVGQVEQVVSGRGSAGRIEVVTSTDGDGVVRIVGELDASIAPALRQVLGDLIDAGHRPVTVDASAMTFLDSAGLGALVRAARRLAEDGGRLHLRALSPSARRVFQITGVDRLVEMDEASPSPT